MLKLLIAVAITVSFVTVIFAQVDASSTGPDHYLLYTARATESEVVELDDQFTVGAFTEHRVKDMALLGNPADKTFAGYVGRQHPGTHLTAYRVSRRGGPSNATVTVTNQFPSIDVRVGKPRFLLVPASKSVDGPVAPLAEDFISHFNCYDTRLRSEFTPLQVTVNDQFTGGGKVIDVLSPRFLCPPTEKKHITDFPILNPDLLMCYSVRFAAGEPVNDLVDPVWVTDQFDAREIRSDTRRPVMLCVPSEIE